MAHPLVAQLRFARSEFERGLAGVSPEDGIVRLQPMNCISWIVGHLAAQEQTYWVMAPGGQPVAPELFDLVGWGRPASTPPLADMWDVWRRITSAADTYLDTLTAGGLQAFPLRDGRPNDESYGTLLLRNTYHYWFHLGEGHAVRQQLGHKNLPQFVGDMTTARYVPENWPQSTLAEEG